MGYSSFSRHYIMINYQFEGMIAVATTKVVLIEFPAELSEEVAAGEDAYSSFSKNMHDLLSDHNIVKVFCDRSGIQQSAIIGSKEMSRIPKMEVRCVERMCEDQMNYDGETTRDNEGGIPLRKVLEYCTAQYYPGASHDLSIMCVFMYGYDRVRVISN